MTDDFNRDQCDTPHGNGRNHYSDPLSELETALEIARVAGYRVTADAVVYERVHANSIKGITPPDWYTIYRDVNQLGLESRKRMIESLHGFEVLQPLCNPLASPVNLKRLISLYNSIVQHDVVTPIDYNPRIANVLASETPLDFGTAWLPHEDWFDPQIRTLSFGDIFSLWRDEALELVKLHLGRICVGPTDELELRSRKPLVHTYRNFLVIDGSFPGQGKSTLFKKLIRALRAVGYNVADGFPALNSTFNLGGPIQSELLYRDDITSVALDIELKSPVAKILATSGLISTQDKGVDAVPIRCRGAVIYCANRVERSLRDGLDEGMQSRLLIAPTMPRDEVASENLPFMAIPRFAAEFNVDENAILLWACRLATNEFLKYTDTLEQRMSELIPVDSRIQVDPLDAVMYTLAFVVFLAGKPLPKYLDSETFHSMVYYLRVLKQARESFLLNTEIQRSYDRQHWHPIHGLKMINVLCLPSVHAACPSGARDPNHALREGLKTIAFRNGSQCYGNPRVAMDRWEDLRHNQSYVDKLQQLAINVTNAVESQPRDSDRISNLSQFTDVLPPPSLKKDFYYDLDS